MIEYKGFAGIMDTDNPPTGVSKGFHILANNGRFKGVNGILRFENVEGNREITYAQPAGTNECIGAFFSVSEQSIYFFLCNSESNHSIQVVNVETELVTQILQSNLNTAGDILKFNLNNPIHSIDILYGSDGNFLTFVDSLGIPTEINLNLFRNTPYTITKRAFIDVAKSPFAMPPKCAYENDNTATANNLRNSLFQFRARPIYNNNEKSVYSTGSEVPLPYLPLSQDITTDVTKNSRICVYVPTGDVNVKSIEIAGRKTLLSEDGGQIISDWFTIITLVKSDLSIPNNSIYRYLFLNDSAYPTIPTEGTDPNTQVLNLQDYVPQKAFTQALLNGNVLGYANITEGYNKVNANIQITSQLSSLGRADCKNGILFLATQSGLPSIGTIGDNITIYLSGAGTNDSGNTPITLANSLDARFVFRAQDSSYVDKSIQFTSIAANANISDILAGISAVAVSVGYTQVSISANQLVLSYPNIILLSSQIYCDDDMDINDVTYANALTAKYSYGIQYFDDKGRTNGVTYGASLNTLNAIYVGTQSQLKIYHRPPLWATYYNVVRTTNTTYNKLLNWVSDSAFSNKSGDNNTLYAYIGITNIGEYNTELDAANDSNANSDVVSYEFQKGDRIRFLGRLLDNGTIDPTGFNSIDYEILGTVENPIINGVTKNGTYIKILYPTSAIGANFKFDGTAAYQNYQILLYSVADRLDKDLQFFFEFGQEYGIGNAGTGNAYHAGMIQTQSIDLSQPAIIQIDKGDLFYRHRNVLAGARYNITTGSYPQMTAYSTLQVNVPNSPIVQGNYTLIGGNHYAAQPDNTGYPLYSDNDELIGNTGSTKSYDIRLKGTQPYTPPPGDPFFAMYAKVVDSSNNVTLYTLVDLQQGLNSTIAYQYQFDATVSLPPNTKLWLIIHNNGNGAVAGMPFTLDVINNVNIPIVEKSFSDLYDLELSANSRVTVIYENAAQLNYGTRFRWGKSYLQDTNLNNINRFSADDYDEWDRAKGDVKRLKVRERLLKIFQSKATGQTGIYTKFVQDSGNTNILATTDDIITKNNINYYEGQYGIGDYPTSLVSTDAVDIFVDHVIGEQVVSDSSGLRTLGSLYLGQYYIRDLLNQYNKTWTKSDGSRANILGVYNYVDEEYNCLLQGGINGSNTILNYNFSFNFKRKGYSSFFDWHPEWSISANEKIYSWLNGKLYVHDNIGNGGYCNFYGIQYDSYLTIPFNDNVFGKKSWQGMVQLASTVWACPEIYTDVISYNAFVQKSNLVTSDFRLKEGMYHASFLRDINSVKGISGGDKLKGNYLVAKLQPIDSSNLVFLTAISIKYLNSPLIPA